MAVDGPEGSRRLLYYYYYDSRFGLPLTGWLRIAGRRTPTEESNHQGESYRGDCFILIGIGLGSLGPPAAERILGVLNNGRWIPQNQS